MLGTEGANHPNPVNIADSWPIHSIVSEKYRLTEYGGGAWRPFVAPGLIVLHVVGVNSGSLIRGWGIL